jgi:hypothetical protein
VEAVNAYLAKIFTISVASQGLHGQQATPFSRNHSIKSFYASKKALNVKKVIVRKGIA